MLPKYWQTPEDICRVLEVAILNCVPKTTNQSIECSNRTSPRYDIWREREREEMWACLHFPGTSLSLGPGVRLCEERAVAPASDLRPRRPGKGMCSRQLLRAGVAQLRDVQR